MLAEKYREGQKELHCVFIDLERAYNRVPREEVCYCLRKKGVFESYVQCIQDKCHGCMTEVRCAVGKTAPFKVEVGVHAWSCSHVRGRDANGLVESISLCWQSDTVTLLANNRETRPSTIHNIHIDVWIYFCLTRWTTSQKFVTELMLQTNWE